MAKDWRIHNGSRAHTALNEIQVKNYNQLWTTKTLEKLVAYGLAELVPGPERWGRDAKRAIITPEGKSAYFVALHYGYVRVAPPASPSVKEP